MAVGEKGGVHHFFGGGIKGAVRSWKRNLFPFWRGGEKGKKKKNKRRRGS